MYKFAFVRSVILNFIKRDVDVYSSIIVTRRSIHLYFFRRKKKQCREARRHRAQGLDRDKKDHNQRDDLQKLVRLCAASSDAAFVSEMHNVLTSIYLKQIEERGAVKTHRDYVSDDRVVSPSAGK